MTNKLWILGALCAMTLQLAAQDVSHIEFCDKKYEYGLGKDSITLFMKAIDSDGNSCKDITPSDLEKYLVVYEDKNIISPDRRMITTVSSGQRIPSDFTFSVLVDLSIPEEGKQQIYEAFGRLVESAPDSCVYLAFMGDDVTTSQLVTKQNLRDFEPKFKVHAENKYFYGALYAKLAEFNTTQAEMEGDVNTAEGYVRNTVIAQRAQRALDKNILFIFTEGNKRPTDETISFIEVTDYQSDASKLVPRVYAFYYTGEGIDENVELTLQGVSTPRNADGKVLNERKGAYIPSDNLSSVLSNFQQVVKDAMYDFAFTYQATEGKAYTGRVAYTAEWKGMEAGVGNYSIGTAETPWPLHEESTGDVLTKFLVAIMVALLTILFFFLVMKVIIPFFKSKGFESKYYKKYVPEENVQRRICTYCRQNIEPGQLVVTKCKHIIHVSCWQQNGYKCVEYGQNCKEGIQEHVDLKEMFSATSLQESMQIFSGILAGLVSWMIFEVTGRGLFPSLGEAIAKTFFLNENQTSNLLNDCAGKVSAFLTVGLLLGFFLSLVFRFLDEYRNKSLMIYLKILGLSCLTSIVGMAAFAVGGIIFCLLLSAVGTTYIPWYCSLPAYILFSICTALSLTVKSSIPMKSAFIGGLCSAVIGFIVLYFSGSIGGRYGWLNMLLDFIIYGGGLGASLVTVRMLAEKYFLVIKNGVKAGQRIPIHKWMNATGGGNKVSIGMTGECEIQMNWEKSSKVAKEHVQLYIDKAKMLPMAKALAPGAIYNVRSELTVGKPVILTNGDTLKIGDTTFEYVEN